MGSTCLRGQACCPPDLLSYNRRNVSRRSASACFGTRKWRQIHVHTNRAFGLPKTVWIMTLRSPIKILLSLRLMPFFRFPLRKPWKPLQFRGWACSLRVGLVLTLFVALLFSGTANSSNKHMLWSVTPRTSRHALMTPSLGLSSGRVATGFF